MSTSWECWGCERFLGCTEASYEKVFYTNKLWYCRVMSLPDYKMHFPLIVSLRNKDVLCFLFRKQSLNHRQSVQLAHQRGRQQKRHLTHLRSAFPFELHFLLVFHAEVRAVLWGQVCAECTLLCWETQGNAAPLSVQPPLADGVVLGQQMATCSGNAQLAH